MGGGREVAKEEEQGSNEEADKRTPSNVASLQAPRAGGGVAVNAGASRGGCWVTLAAGS